MMKLFKFLFVILLIAGIVWFAMTKMMPSTKTVNKHRLLVENIEAMGKLELVKYRISDILEHKNISTYLPDASVLLIIRADAVGCVDLTKITPESITVQDDSVSIRLPNPEVCYVKINHDESQVYDTKMAFFREAQLVDEAFKEAERKVSAEVKKSDILKQTKTNAIHVLKPFVQGLGFTKMTLTFEEDNI